MNSTDLQKLIDRKLNELSPPQAPPTLLPRVLAAVQCQLRRPWYERSWRTWPHAMQASSVGALAGVFLGLAALEPAAQSAWSEILSALARSLSQITGDFLATLSAAGALRRVLLEPVFGFVVVLGVLMGTACAAVGAILTRVTGLGGAS